MSFDRGSLKTNWLSKVMKGVWKHSGRWEARRHKFSIAAFLLKF